MAGAHEAPGRRGAPGVPGTTRAAIQLPPLSPSAPVRTQVFPPGRPGGRRRAAAYGPRVEGPDPVDDAGERRIPRGGSLQESKFQVWPAANHPQTPSLPATRGHRASGAAGAKADARHAGATAAEEHHCGGERGTRPNRTQAQRGDQPGREGLIGLFNTMETIAAVSGVSAGFRPPLHILTDDN